MILVARSEAGPDQQYVWSTTGLGKVSNTRNMSRPSNHSTACDAFTHRCPRQV